MINSKRLAVPKIFFTIILFFGLVNILSAQDADFIATPSNVNVSPNDTFSVVIQVQINSGEIDAAEIHLDFDPTVLQVNALTNVGAAQLGIPVLSDNFNVQVDNNNGTIDLAYGNLFGANPTTSFDFIQIDLTALSAGTTSLAFGDIFPRESKITSGGINVLGNASDVPVEVALANEDPVASFFATPTSGTAELLVNVDASASTDNGGIESFEWDFGDGNTATGVTASNNYLNMGSYTISLLVTDDLGATNTTTQSIIVDEVVIPNYTITASAGTNGTIDPLNANIASGSNQTFTITPDAGYEIEDVLVDGASVGAVETYEFSNVQANATISVSFSEIPPFQLCIASGSAALTALGRTFEQDNANAGATAHPTRTNGKKYGGYTGPISGTAPGSEAELLFQKEIYGGAGGNNPNFSYDIPVANGFYQVDLYFAEVFHATTGKRIFDVSLEGNLILDEYEIVDPIKDGISTFQTAITRTYYVNVQDGSLQVGIGSASVDNGKLSGLCITAVSSANVHPIANIGALNFDASVVVAQPLNITDADNDQLSISFNGMPTSIIYNSSSNQLEGTPTVAEVGTYTINAIISDGTNSPVTEEFELVINAPAGDAPPTIVEISDIEISEGGTVSVVIQVNDDNTTDPTASIIIYDKSVPGGTNNPFAPAATVSGYTFVDNGGGNFTLNWITTNTDGRSYEARVTADDGVNPTVESRFNIDVAQNIADIIPARTFSSPLPWYGGNPAAPFSVAIENTPDQNLGWIDPGEFVEYLIEVPVAGAYDLEIFTGKGNVGPLTITFSEESSGGFNTLGTIDANQSGWQNYVPGTTQVTFTNAGLQTLRLDFSGAGGVNIRDFNFTAANDFPPVIDAIANVEVDEGDTLTVPISVTDDTLPEAVVSIEIFDKSEPGGTNNPFTPALTISGYTFSNDGGGNYSLVWNTAGTDGRSYEARVTTDDGVNAPVIETFTIDVAQDILGVILARTFTNPLPWYGNSPVAPFTVSIEAAGNIGWTGAGEFTEYLIDVPAAGTYDLRINASKGANNSGLLTISEENGGGFATVGTVTINQNGWTTFEDYTTEVTFSNSGLQTLRFDFAGGMNLTEFEFTEVANNIPVVSITSPTDNMNVTRGQDVTLTATAIDTEDGDISGTLAWTSDDTQFSSTPLDGIGASITAQLITPGAQTIRASVTDSEGETSFDEITVNVLGPQVNITSPEDSDVIVSTDVRIEWTGTDVLFGLTEHFHIFVNPPDINNIDTDTRISTASQVGQEFWDLTAVDGIQEGNNTIVIRVANQFHEEFTNTEAQDEVTFTVCTTDITSVTPQNPSDCSLDDGEIAIVATGTSLEYSIDNGVTFVVSNSFSNLAAGTYDIVVREAGTTTCTATEVAILTAPEAPSISDVASNDPADCDSDNGSIVVTATGTSLEYSIDNGVTFAVSNSFSNLAAGTYDIVVLEAGTTTCTATAVAILTAPEAPSISNVASNDPADCDSDNGSIVVTATGTSLEYSIDNGVTFAVSNSFSNLASGSYNIVVRNIGTTNCIAIDSVTLTAPEAPSITSVSPTNPTTCSGTEGAIMIVATGNNLEYSVNNGSTFQTAADFSELVAGTYTIVVREMGTISCIATSSIVLEDPMGPTPTISGPLTYLEGSGGVTLDAGLGWVSYLWSPGGETTQTITAGAGTYTVTVVNANGCEGTSIGVIVTEDEDNTPPEAICQSIEVQLDTNGNASITAAQIDNGSTDISGIASLVLSKETFTCADIGENTVMLTVTDGNGNVSNCTATVIIIDKITPTITCPVAVSSIVNGPQILEIIQATAIDNCDNSIMTTFVRSDNASLGLNDPFPIGQTMIQWTAMDAAGNVDVCIQTITLTMSQSMSNDIIAFSVPNQIGAEIIDSNLNTVDLTVAIGTDVSVLLPTIQISSLAGIAPNSGVIQDFSNPIIYTVTAEDGSTQQWTVTVTIEADTTPPSLISLNPLDNSTDIDEDAILMATFDEPVQLSTGGEITITDLTDNTAFGIVGLNGPITFVGNTLSIDPMALFEAGHEYSVEIPNTALEDLSGNPFAGIPINGWTFTIFDDTTPPEIICPDDIVVDNDPGECGAVVNYNIPFVNGGNSLLARAIPVVEGEPLRTEGLPTGAFFPIGTTTVTYEVTDENGNTASCSFDVTVNDTELPTISCTTDMNWVAALGDTSLVVNFTTPDFDDNCPSATIVQTAGLASGVAFPIGVTTNTFEVTDASGNKETCSFDITIEAEVPTTLSVTSFTLVDADTDQDLFTLVEGMQIDMNSLPTLRLDIRANTTSDVESVRFNLSGELTRSHGESLPPYALFRDLPIGDYMGADFVEGGYSLTGTPYSEDSLRGDQGTPLTVSFSLVDGDPACESLTAEVVVVNPLTCDGIGSRITIVPSGGTAPFEVSWQNFSSEDESIDDLTAGTYTIDVTDSNGCSIRVEAVIVNPELPEVTLEPFTNMLVSDAAIILDQGSPMGGSYSGVGVSGSDTFNPMTAGAGTHEITYTYTDPVTLCRNMSIGQITVSNPSAFALRINTGGVETTYNTNIFMTDAYFNTGNVLDRPQTGLPEPFQTFRYSTSQQMSYDIPLPDGEYIVNLYFAELWFGASGGGLPGAGRRVFDVSIEGQLEEDNLDIFAEVGAETMLIKSHTVTVTGGVLDIDFNATDAVGGERHPVINAIEILGSGIIVPENPIANAGPDREIELPTNELTLDGSGSDPDGGTVTFEWFVISGPNSPGVANINTKDVTVSNMIEGTYVFRLDVTDDENVTVSDLVTVTVLPEPIVGDFAMRINAGGTEIVYDNNVFITDTYFDVGRTLDRPQTGLPDPFKTFRYSPSQQLGYDIPVPDGEYTVNLYFAELWFGATGGGLPGAGRRVFDVSIEGQLEEDNLDIFAEVGAETMLIKSHTVTVTGGVLNIDFNSTDAVGGVRHPVINAIEIIENGVSIPTLALSNANTNKSVLSPNPVISITSLSFEKPVQLSDIQVFDVAGRLIRTFKSAEVFAKGVYNLDVYDLESGIYFINALDTQGVLHQKQMVIKK